MADGRGRRRGDHRRATCGSTKRRLRPVFRTPLTFREEDCPARRSASCVPFMAPGHPSIRYRDHRTAPVRERHVDGGRDELRPAPVHPDQPPAAGISGLEEPPGPVEAPPRPACSSAV